jgi:hypothetical protein
VPDWVSSLIGVLVGAGIAAYVQGRFERRREVLGAVTALGELQMEFERAKAVILWAQETGRWWPPEVLEPRSVSKAILSAGYLPGRKHTPAVARGAGMLMGLHLKSLVAVAENSPELADEDRDWLEGVAKELDEAEGVLDASGMLTSAKLARVPTATPDSA